MAPTLKSTSLNYSAAAVAAGDAEELAAFVDFLNRVRTRDGNLYSKFLVLMGSYKCGELSGFQVHGRVVKLFGNHYDLIALFTSFVPESYVSPISYCKKRKIDHLEPNVDFLIQVRARFGPELYDKFLGLMESYKSREFTASELNDQVVKMFGEHRDLIALFRSFVVPNLVDIPRKQRSYHLKIRKINEDICSVLHINVFDKTPEKKVRVLSKNEEFDFDMEDSMCRVDVEISNLESTYENALNLLSSRDLLVPGFCFQEHLPELNLAFIRKLSRKPLLVDSGNPTLAVSVIIDLLGKKREALKKTRDNLIKRWNKSRQSR